MQAYHIPVLLKETLKLLQPQKNKTFIDGTLGGGGHTRALLDTGARVIGLDRDPEAIEHCRTKFRGNKNLKLMHGNFALINECSRKKVDGILLDLGIASHQIDTPDRGFSFRLNGPLDMRMNQGVSTTAKGILNNASAEELNEIFKTFGEERFAHRITKEICHARKKKYIGNTATLAEIIKCAVPDKNPTHQRSSLARIFQALRIKVNQELAHLSSGLVAALTALKPKGRLVIISYHSLEDKIVKTFFKTEAKACACDPKIPVCICNHQKTIKILTKKPVTPTAEEIKLNPRATSAKLRAAEKL